MEKHRRGRRRSDFCKCLYCSALKTKPGANDAAFYNAVTQFAAIIDCHVVSPLILLLGEMTSFTAGTPPKGVEVNARSILLRGVLSGKGLICRACTWLQVFDAAPTGQCGSSGFAPKRFRSDRIERDFQVTLCHTKPVVFVEITGVKSIPKKNIQQLSGHAPALGAARQGGLQPLCGLVQTQLKHFFSGHGELPKGQTRKESPAGSNRTSPLAAGRRGTYGNSSNALLYGLNKRSIRHIRRLLKRIRRSFPVMSEDSSMHVLDPSCSGHDASFTWSASRLVDNEGVKGRQVVSSAILLNVFQEKPASYRMRAQALAQLTVSRAAMLSGNLNKNVPSPLGSLLLVNSLSHQELLSLSSHRPEYSERVSESQFMRADRTRGASRFGKGKGRGSAAAATGFCHRNLRCQSRILPGGQLEHEVLWEPPAVAFHRFIESERWHAIEGGKVAIQNHFLSAHSEDHILDRI
jgi:hypothetical protein